MWLLDKVHNRSFTLKKKKKKKKKKNHPRKNEKKKKKKTLPALTEQYIINYFLLFQEKN
jgi:hypothetical protein